ncbi:hypothetical protein [Verrucomicrobium sp. BvORR106]|uniref:hypothetical protein n=1 Tax=Verrucomicrobium sp. BvORR106 TaxID=1403819 RepID=UPI002240F1A2|nr:hypothetical protein [Verrucomicrobium sp. BvORR106]
MKTLLAFLAVAVTLGFAAPQSADARDRRHRHHHHRSYHHHHHHRHYCPPTYRYYSSGYYSRPRYYGSYSRPYYRDNCYPPRARVYLPGIGIVIR